MEPQRYSKRSGGRGGRGGGEGGGEEGGGGSEATPPNPAFDWYGFNLFLISRYPLLMALVLP